jgi:hypothetical protein
MGLRFIGSLWVSKAGQKSKLNGYLDGPNRTRGERIVVIPNEKATGENRQPQYRLCVQEDEAPKKDAPPPDGAFGDFDEPPF